MTVKLIKKLVTWCYIRYIGYCDIKNDCLYHVKKEMNVKCWLLKLKYRISHSDLYNTMFKH